MPDAVTEVAEVLTPPTAHQFESLEQQKDADVLGMWVFLTTEILFFGGMFCAYAVYRSLYHNAFAAASETIDLWLGTINTAVLISSSLTMAMAVHAAKTGARKALIAFLIATLVLGSIFLGIKGLEYYHKFEEHHVPGPSFHFEQAGVARHAQIFFSFYFAMTGMHALHMIIGAGMLLVLIFQAYRGRYNAVYFMPVEIGGLYWHFVDIVWIFLFPLLYLVGHHHK